MNTIDRLLMSVGVFLIIGTGIYFIDYNAKYCAKLRQEAVQRGYAEWVVDQKTGTTTWKWKENK